MPPVVIESTEARRVLSLARLRIMVILRFQIIALYLFFGFPDVTPGVIFIEIIWVHVLRSVSFTIGIFDFPSHPIRLFLLVCYLIRSHLIWIRLSMIPIPFLLAIKVCRFVPLELDRCLLLAARAVAAVAISIVPLVVRVVVSIANDVAGSDNLP